MEHQAAQKLQEQALLQEDYLPSVASKKGGFSCEGSPDSVTKSESRKEIMPKIKGFGGVLCFSLGARMCLQ